MLDFPSVDVLEGSKVIILIDEKKMWSQLISFKAGAH